MSGRRSAAMAILAMALCAADARAEPVSRPDGWALGFMLGAPSGLVVKHWLGSSNAIDLAIGVGPGVRLHSDFLWGIAELTDEPEFELDLYIGLGALIGTPRGWCGTTFRPNWECRSSNLYGGVRVPFGVDARLRNAPIDLGLEVAPGAWFSESFGDGLLDAFFFLHFRL